MATFISVGTGGDWEDPATWDVGVGYPVAGDIAVAATGDTITTTTDVACATLWVDGTFILGAGDTLTISANINVRGNAGGAGQFTASAGSTVAINSASVAGFSIIPGWNGNAKLSFNGTAENRVTVIGSGGGAHLFDWNTGNGYMQRFVATYTDFSGFRGSSGNNTFDFTLAGGFDDYISFTNCSFDRVFWHQNTFIDSDATFELINNTFKNSNASNLSFNFYYSKGGSGVRTITGNVFDQSPRYWGQQGITNDDNIYLEGYTTINEAVGA